MSITEKFVCSSSDEKMQQNFKYVPTTESKCDVIHELISVLKLVSNIIVADPGPDERFAAHLMLNSVSENLKQQFGKLDSN